MRFRCGLGLGITSLGLLFTEVSAKGAQKGTLEICGLILAIDLYIPNNRILHPKPRQLAATRVAVACTELLT